MNDEVKEILIDLVEYYNVIGTDKDPGFGAFENVAQRASKALEHYAEGIAQRTKDVDPFKSYDEFPDYVMKMEDDL